MLCVFYVYTTAKMPAKYLHASPPKREQFQWTWCDHHSYALS